MEQTQLILAALQRSTLFSALPQEQRRTLVEQGECLPVESGELIIQEGLPQEACYIILEGEFEIIKSGPEGELVLTVQGRGEIVGEMSLLTQMPPTATVRAACPSQVLKISQEQFRQLLRVYPALSFELLRVVTTRLRNTEVMLNQHEKLASLGTLAAGLAHELNNPAAAARRSSSLLRSRLLAWLEARKGLDALGLDPDLNETILSRLISDILLHDHHDAQSDPLERSDQEQHLEAWLEARGMSDAWEHAPALVEFGWHTAALEKWQDVFSGENMPTILRWLAEGYRVHSLLDEINHSVERLSEIVAAVKSYTYLDEAPKKEIDIHEGLENTLIILKHKLNQGITIQRDYDRSLPKIEAYGSELNQVWTNLIDNAIDAMAGQGTLRLRTARQGDALVVEIGDSGAGIPESALKHIFEPFFTTKEPGKGTGLGLHVSYNIIKKHRGQITVQSQPGDTRFKVSLPILPSIA